ncbi:GNAT family N-acetyltransferase [Marininema halotolerans]|uniref:Protein N-acetyltransferase, RimJ/RimL family n=1 Tax=Marininema halotolerans TaxID=1155944 RepID=A0A1I6UBX9_9BACL|nr:GNAT family N-acetyltransferase [Marininema halotolerans]SFS98945.1 Protein N-acetyltransferase, RimJ/RimL family [Marininema halotolerans]
MREQREIVQIKGWEEDDLDLLFQLNAPEMMNHLGGPEREEKVFSRHQRYLALKDKGSMYSIQLQPQNEKVGSVGFWHKSVDGEEAYEVGWSVLPSFQGKGIATRATKLAIKEALAKNNWAIHAFPSIDNPGSNAICRKLHFSFLTECEFEYPPGNLMRCNHWRLEASSIR